MNARRALAWSPWLVAGLYSLLMALPPTRKLAFELQRENGPIEFTTFLLLAAAGVFALLGALRAPTGLPRFLLGGAAIVFLFVAGEEAAWGQHFLGEPLSATWAESNRQGETTIHNLPALQGKSELSYLLAAILALLMRRPAAERRLGPTRVRAELIPGLILIICFAVVEILSALVEFPHLLDEGLRHLAEVVEMVVGGVAMAWAWASWKATRMLA